MAITALVSSQTPAIPVTDHYASNDPFDVTTRAGDRSFKEISKPLNTIWYGTAQTFPSFSSNLARHANDGGWDRLAHHGILNDNIKDVLEEIKSITKADLVAARITRIYPISKKNCKSLFKCLESSIIPSVKSTFFDQPRTSQQEMTVCSYIANLHNSPPLSLHSYPYCLKTSYKSSIHPCIITTSPWSIPSFRHCLSFFGPNIEPFQSLKNFNIPSLYTTESSNL